VPRPIRLIAGGDEWTAELGPDGVSVSGASGPRVVHDEGDGRFRVEGEGGWTGVAVMAGSHVWVSVDHVVFEFKVASGSARPGARGLDALAPPMPATVIRLAVSPGDAVKRGDVLIVLEAMKMEMPIRAPFDGVIAAVHCREGDLVQPGPPLVEYDGAKS
jgi:biotin carboxyl carrier protein